MEPLESAEDPAASGDRFRRVLRGFSPPTPPAFKAVSTRCAAARAEARASGPVPRLQSPPSPCHPLSEAFPLFVSQDHPGPRSLAEDLLLDRGMDLGGRGLLRSHLTVRTDRAAAFLAATVPSTTREPAHRSAPERVRALHWRLAASYRDVRTTVGACISAAAARRRPAEIPRTPTSAMKSGRGGDRRPRPLPPGANGATGELARRFRTRAGTRLRGTRPSAPASRTRSDSRGLPRNRQ